MRPSKQQDYKVITPRSPERILKRRIVNNQTQYQIKWKGQEEITWELEDNVRKSLIEDYQQTNSSSSNSVNDRIPVIKQVASSLKHPNYSEELLLNKQKEMSSKIQSSHPQKSDIIESVHLILTDEQCVFEVKWKPRPVTGVVPLSDYYQYEQFKLVSPMLFMNFLEVCMIGRENKSDIQFYAPGETPLQRAYLMKKVLLKNPKYRDAGRNLDNEEQKQNVQSELITPSKHVISFIQSEKKQSQTNQSEQSERRCQVDIQDNSNPEQQQQQSQQDPQDESQEPGEIQPQQDEQEEQRSISLEGQKD